MDKTAIQTSVPPVAVPAPAATAGPAPKPARRRGPVMQFVLALASLKLTVALMALALGLVFVGTLAQVDEGIWTVVEKYFRSAFVLVPLQLFFPRAWHVPGAVPYPASEESPTGVPGWGWQARWVTGPDQILGSS